MTQPIHTRIPERPVQGLEYGAHYSAPDGSWSGYYVRPAGSELPMVVARTTPATDELEDSDEAIVKAIQTELRSRAIDRALAGDMPPGGPAGVMRQVRQSRQ